MKHTECEDCKLRNGDCGHHFKGLGYTNYGIPSSSACDRYGNCEFFQQEEIPQGDLISREALKEHKFLSPQVKVIGGRRCGKTREQIIEAYQKGWNDCIDAIIDNAPTVEPMSCRECPFVADEEKQITNSDARASEERTKGEWGFSINHTTPKYPWGHV